MHQVEIRVTSSQLPDGTAVTMFSVRFNDRSGEYLRGINERLVELEHEGVFRTPIALIVGTDDALATSVAVLRLALSFWVVAVNRPGWGNIVVASRSDRFPLGERIEITGPTGPS